jgi:hypothetical protein
VLDATTEVINQHSEQVLTPIFYGKNNRMAGPASRENIVREILLTTNHEK